MGKYLDAERPSQFAGWEQHAAERSLDPRHAGEYPFMLPPQRAHEPLYTAERANEDTQRSDTHSVEYYFDHGRITWHPACVDLCGLQVACLNFFFPLSTHRQALADLLRETREPGTPSITRVSAIDPGSASPFVAFEYIGPEDVLSQQRGNRAMGGTTSRPRAVVRLRVGSRRECAQEEQRRASPVSALTIATWNPEYRQSHRRRSEIDYLRVRDVMTAVDADVWVLTESHPDVCSLEGHQLAATSCGRALDRPSGAWWVSLRVRTGHGVAVSITDVLHT